MDKKEEITGPFCPCCKTGAGALELLVWVLDLYDKETGGQNRDVQDDLIEWANNIKELDSKCKKIPLENEIWTVSYGGTWT